MEFLHGPASQVVNTDLAAALGTLGIPRDAEHPLQIMVGDVEQVAFFFEEASPCGTYRAAEMIPAWDSAAFWKSHPKHALNYMRCAMYSRRRLLAYAKKQLRVGIVPRAGGQMEVVSLPDHMPAPKRSAAAVPGADAATTPRLMTEDLELAACLLACGVPLWADLPVQRGVEDRVAFFFHAASPCGAFQTRDLMLAWQDHKWHESHPEHPFAYVSCAMENRRRLMREIKRKTPMIVFMRAGWPQFLTLNADPKTEGIFMKELNKL